MLTVLALTGAVLGGSTETWAETGGKSAGIVAREMEARKIPGLQYAIVRQGQIVESGAIGLANVELGASVTSRTLFQINSITKAFTGVAVMQLAQQGKLELDRPVSMYLADLPPAWAKVTVRQLLTNTSGLPQLMDGNGQLIAVDFAESWRKLRKLPLESAPGTQFSYNGTNYVLVGMLIDQLSGEPFARFIANRQFDSVGMPLTKQAGFVDAYDIVIGSARVYSFARLVRGAEVRGETLSNNPFEEFPPPLRTAAGMYSTAEELAKWLIALQSGKLIDRQALETLWTPGRLKDGSQQGFTDFLNGYALGWVVASRPQHRAVGGVGGGRAAFFVYPDDDLAVVILTNLRGGSPESFIDAVAAPYLEADSGKGTK
jgi:CubicO group peptidase (beta-lactamase class C family)